MNILKAIHYTLAFTLEMCMLVILGYYGFKSSSNPFLKYGLMILLPVLAGIAWGIWAAPKSETRLDAPALVVFKLAIFLVSAFLLYRTGVVQLSVWFAVLSVISVVAGFFLGH